MKSQNQALLGNGALTIADAFQRTLDYLEAKGSPGRLFFNSLSIDQQLQMYAHYKQIKHGDCDEETPSKWNYKAYRKQQAWEELRGTSNAQAQRDYVNRVIEYSQDVSGLEGLIEKARGWLDRVQEVDDAEPAKQTESREQFDTKRVAATAKKNSTPTLIFALLASFFSILCYKPHLLLLPPNQHPECLPKPLR